MLKKTQFWVKISCPPSLNCIFFGGGGEGIFWGGFVLELTCSCVFSEGRLVPGLLTPPPKKKIPP